MQARQSFDRIDIIGRILTFFKTYFDRNDFGLVVIQLH